MAAPKGVKGNLLRQSWERWQVSGPASWGDCPRSGPGSSFFREVAQRNAILHKEWASQRPETAATAEGPADGWETGAQALLFGLGSGSWRGQKAMLSCGHPLVTSLSQDPGKGSAGDPLSRGSSVFSLLQGKALPQGSGLAGFTSWQLTMDSGPWGGIKKGMFQTEPHG